MRKLLLGACLTALFSTAAEAKQHFTYTDKFDQDVSTPILITGSFDGTLNGNQISDLSNISVFFDGQAFKGNGNLYAARFAGYDFEKGGAVASLDGTENNFLFVDSDYPDYTNFKNFFFSIPGGARMWRSTGQDIYQFGASNFRAQVAGVPEPASWALMIGGFGLAGAALRTNRRKTIIRYA